ncbi:hypothetical protein [Chitinolyticbacter meiyuanensis]|uniref:hypothetical protein n=1 Tax=Chitinolyticbacter meiyuanensis TaxID=682798 RepID=UPI0011E59B59|nr:hypothetical protein [Chitinolyticbacter meiyuanensis]
MALKRALRAAAALLPLLAILLYAAQYFGAWQPPWYFGQRSVSALRIGCADLSVSCHFEIAGQSFQLRSDQPLRPATAFMLELHGPVHEARAEWQMRDMEMVPNSARFEPAASGGVKLRTALPLCSAARNDWLLRLTLDGHVVEIDTRSTSTTPAS